MKTAWWQGCSFRHRMDGREAVAVYEYDSCEPTIPFDNGQNDVTDGSVENYDFDWNEEEAPQAEPS